MRHGGAMPVLSAIWMRRRKWISFHDIGMWALSSLSACVHVTWPRSHMTNTYRAIGQGHVVNHAHDQAGIYSACGPHHTRVDWLHQTRRVLLADTILQTKQHTLGLGCDANMRAHQDAKLRIVASGACCFLLLVQWNKSLFVRLAQPRRDMSFVFCWFLTGLNWARTKTISVQTYWFNIHFGASRMFYGLQLEQCQIQSMNFKFACWLA